VRKIQTLAALALCAVPALAQQPAWPEITSTMRPWCYNWWMGSAVDEAGLDLQAKQLADAGLGGIHVVPIYEAIDEKRQAVDYLSDEWMRLFSVAKAKGAAKGLGADMTTGCGWNFGGPHIPRRLGVWNLHRLGPGDAPLPGGEVLWRGKDADGREVRLEAAPTGRQVDKAPKSWKGVMIDPCSKEAMRTFLEPFDRAFARPGAVRPRCFYHDSYAYHETTWSPEPPSAFRRLRGYALEDHYAELAGIGDAEAIARVKHDYRETISDMIVESFAGWTAWAHGLGAKTRNQAHGAPANLLDFYAAADIPETEMFNTARNILMSKFASSPAHVRGGGLVSAESCTWIDEHFCATLGECKRFIDQLFLSGVDHVFYHGCCYSPPDVAWPGWCFYATLEMNPRNPIWRDARTLSDWIARYQSIAQTSVPDEDVLLYWPIHDTWRKLEGFSEQFVLLQAGGWLMQSELGKAARRLYDAGVSFDYVSDRQLLGLPPRDKTHYTTIVVPSCKTIPLATARRLGELARSGYKVICVGERPSDVPGFIRPEESDAVRKAMEDVGNASIDDVGRREPFVGKAGLAYRRMRRGKDVLYYIVNQTAKRVSGTFRPSATTASAWTLDPMDGAIRPAKTSAGAVELALEGSGSVLLWCSPVETTGTGEERAPQVCGEPVEIKGPWTLRRVCGGPEAAWKDRTMTALSSWSRNADGSENPFCGTVLYKTSFVCADGSGDAVLDLGEVCHSARVRVNGRDLGTRIMAPYRFRIPSGALAKGENVLEVEVTSTGSNRLRDLDTRKVNWRVFTHPGILGRNYRNFDASQRPLAPAGLLGPVSLTYSRQTAILPVSPTGGAVFELLPDTQRKVLAGATRVERNKTLKSLDARATRNEWRRHRPLVLKWKAAEGVEGPWRIRIGTKADLSDAKDWWLERDWARKDGTDPYGAQVWTYEAPFANLDLGRTYYWQVWSRVACSGHDCGFTYPESCKCGRTKHGEISPVVSFKTPAQPPRWIALEGKAENVRDLGGWKTVDGCIVRTGMLFRGQGLNENSVSGIDRGRIRLTVEDVRYMTKVLGITTDLDLRGSRETGAMEGSPLGASVRFVNRSSPFYAGIFHPSGMKTMAANFRVFCDRKNYPIYFHCIGGADRTGSLAYVLNGVLGVGKEDLERDWESTFYNGMSIPGVDDPKHARGTQHFDAGFAKYGKPGDPLARRIELYLLACGVTEAEIAAFRSIMLSSD